MSTYKHIDRLCCAAVAAAMLIVILFMNGELLGIQAAARTLGYEERLFDTDRVHTIDIVMDDWDGFIGTCENEEYSPCSVIIDGEAYKNVAIRAKGNTSLSTVSSMNSERYSFKIEFDHYDSTTTYHGLDKISLNNIIQDTTYMKDYLTYRMMAEFGVDAPLCSYAYLTVNGEDWGLYLAVEAVEDGFLQRNYGTDSGELYKPDSMSFGGGRGNGKDFSMDDIDPDQFSFKDTERFDFENFDMDSFDFGSFDREDMGFGGFAGNPSGRGIGGPDDSAAPGDMAVPDIGNMGGGFGGMGSSDVKLQYIDDAPDSYSNIFDNAKTDITAADKARLIDSLKQLSSGENIDEVVNVDKVLRYFVVHNFVVNGDSYTGSMIHNYYLYEKDGQLSMIPWDYNLAFGTFQGTSASDAVNDPIDSPLSITGGDRPMIDWIFDSGEYTGLYHQYFAEFLSSVDILALIDRTKELIAPYVEMDPTKFYSYEEFENGVETLRQFCVLRTESVLGQLDGSIPSTSAGQAEDSSTLINASGLTLSDMGSMGGGQGDVSFPRNDISDGGGWDAQWSTDAAEPQIPDHMRAPDNMQMPGGMQSPDAGTVPERPS